MQIEIDREADSPIYRQIVDGVRAAIAAGSLPAGTRLPPVRRLAADLGITRLTVYSAYSELQAEGLVESHVGRGTYVLPGMEGRPDPTHPPAGQSGMAEGFIADLLRMSERDDIVSFAQAFPAPESIPVAELNVSLANAAHRPDAFGYGPIQGHAELRREVAALLAERGVSVQQDGLLITAGAQQGIDIVFRACTGPGDTIAVEAPTYPAVLELAARHRLRVIGVASDAGGIRVDALQAACRDHHPRLLYMVPTCGNPTGGTLAADRRAGLLRAARTAGMLIVEDDIYGFLAFNPPAPPALQHDDPDVVIHLSSFSKMLAPALRLGALAPPTALLPRLAAAKASADLVCSSLLQLAMADYLGRGCLPPHLTRVQALYRERCDSMLAALGRHARHCSAATPTGGLSLWVKLPDGVIEREVVTDALERGVAVVPGRAFFPHAEPGAHVRLGFGMEPPERIERGVMLLGQVLEEHLRRDSARISLAVATAGPLV